jgi:uncharacterized protein (DUF433 family)
LIKIRRGVLILIVETRYKHIILDKNNVPIITGTTMKVVELVLDSKAYGWSPEELHFQHPHLSLGQIYSALAYYWDHQEELDQDIERRLERVDQIQQELQPTPLEIRLKAKGLI